VGQMRNGAWFVLLLAVFPFNVAARFPLTNSAGVVDAANGTHSVRFFGTHMAGPVVNGNGQASIGFFDADYYTFVDFQSSGLPLKVTPDPNVICTGTLLPSPDRSFRVAWTDGANGVPVRYEFYSGTSVNDLVLVSDQAGLEITLTQLDYLKGYVWRVTAYDVYGRRTESDLYPFSLSPPVGDKIYCAPNPFRAGVETTTFFFFLAGSGGARIDIYSMPHQDLVYSTRLDGLSPGIHVFTYDGRDAERRILHSGLYVAHIKLTSDNHESQQRVKFIVAR
jgi:hypothetical protein